MLLESLRKQRDHPAHAPGSVAGRIPDPMASCVADCVARRWGGGRDLRNNAALVKFVVAKMPPLPGVFTAFVAKKPPLPCVSDECWWAFGED